MMPLWDLLADRGIHPHDVPDSSKDNPVHEWAPALLPADDEPSGAA
jgi:hypothetical protein